jgi:hypothetical protein
MSAPKSKNKKSKPFQNKRITALRHYIFSDIAIKEKLDADLSGSSVLQGLYVVFISICDTKSRALVLKGMGKTLID